VGRQGWFYECRDPEIVVKHRIILGSIKRGSGIRVVTNLQHFKFSILQAGGREHACLIKIITQISGFELAGLPARLQEVDLSAKVDAYVAERGGCLPDKKTIVNEVT